MAEWIACRTLMQQVVGSNPAWPNHTNVHLVWNSSKIIIEKWCWWWIWKRKWEIDWWIDWLMDWLIDWVGYAEYIRYYDNKWYQCIHQTMVYHVNSVFWHFIRQNYIFWIDISVFEIHAHCASPFVLFVPVLAHSCQCQLYYGLVMFL